MTQRQDNELRLGGETFLIRVQYQENATWQGSIQWLDGRKSQTFRSLLEMAMLIQEALEKGSSLGSGFHSWDSREEDILPDYGERDNSTGEKTEKGGLA